MQRGKSSVFFRCAAFLIFTCVAVAAARAEDCHGNPNALGTSRVISVDPLLLRRIGTMEYKETLPLRDHEVVLTFDDGPSATFTSQVLDALAAECVKATFFIVGSMAQKTPSLVKRIQAEGHTIGMHTQHHPWMTRLSREAVKKEIADGIASVAAAAGDPKAVAPFFRFPYFARNKATEETVLALGLMIWGVDFTADDWLLVSPQHVLSVTLARLEQRRKGLIGFHDTEKRTTLALPELLRELKKRGYHVVHVVPSDKEHRKARTLVKQLQGSVQ